MKTIEFEPFTDQKPGTSGLRKKTTVFLGEHYTESFIQSTFNALNQLDMTEYKEKPIVVGGDGRFYNREAIQKIIKIAIANGVSKVLVAKGGILSTPAASAVIRKRQCAGGFILSASHNPGGKNGDFGIKYNIHTGSPAPESLTETIFKESKSLSGYSIIDAADIDLDTLQNTTIQGVEIEVFDGVSDYAELMQELFDFSAIREAFEKGFRLSFDAMHAVTGPYAQYILEELLGAPKGTVLNGTPSEDFGGGHPDPNLAHAKELVEMMNGSSAPHLGAASDGDGDRNMILGPQFFVSPGDSLAMIAEHLKDVAPGYKEGLKGIARSMPTSRAAQFVAEDLGIPCYETPTGWKFFGNLMDANLCTLCGEESFGTSSSHVREKDGLWAVLCWLSILVKTGKSVKEISEEHWKKFGRSYFQRHDFEGVDGIKANEMLEEVKSKLESLSGETFQGIKIEKASNFSYEDPTDGSISENQGIQIELEDQARIVFRLSGTGTSGATLRLYLEKYSKENISLEANEALNDCQQFAYQLLDIENRFGRHEPDVIT